MSDAIGILNLRKTKFLAGISISALILGCLFSSSTSAATYLVSSDGEFRTAISAANGDGDASATIIMTNSFSVSAALLPTPLKSITIDTRGNVLSGVYNASTLGSIAGLTIQQSGAGGVPVIFSGTLLGGSAAAGDTTAGQVAVWVTRTALTNNGSITGGNGGGAGGAGGVGVRAFSGTNLVNNGTITGGASTTDAGGVGVDLGGVGPSPSTLTNNGTIRGGVGPTNGAGLTGVAVIVRSGSGQVVNSGTIEGGTGAAALVSNSGSVDMDIVNSGTIRAGAGQATAIGRSTAATTGTLTLELRAGSVIEGDVVGNAAAIDTLRLGGSGTDNFDVSTIGPAAQYQNFDTFEKTGTGTWLLTGIGTTTTDWTIYDGTLLIGDHTTPTSVIGDITNFGTLGGSGTIVGDVTNSGTVAPGNSIGTLTINGNYTGNSGTLALESVLGGDASSTDRLVVTGDTAGTTTVRVTNLGGAGAQTNEGIKIIDVGGTSAGNFSLTGDYVYQGDQAVIGGAYAYRLYQNGIATPADGDWYLRSTLTVDPATGPLYQPGVPVYEAYPRLLQTMNGLGTLQQRVGGRYWQTGGNPVQTSAPDGVWLRTEGMYGAVDPDTSTTGSSYDYNLWRLEGGLDGALADNASGRLIGGLTLHMSTISADISSVYGKGSIDASGYGIGATLTWYGDDGLYADAQGRLTWYNSDLKSNLVDGALESANKGFGSAISLEAGQRFSAEDWTITPQAQLVYSSIDFDDFNDRFGAPVSLASGGDSLSTRIGLSVDHDESWQKAGGETVHAKLYGAANLYYEFLGDSAVDVAGTTFRTDNDELAAGLTFGGSYNWNEDRTSLYGEVSARSSLENPADTYMISGSAGLRVKW